MNSKAIYRINVESAEREPVIGIFVADKTDVEILIKEKVRIRFSNGLRSFITKQDIELVTDDEGAINIFYKYKMNTGVNPFRERVDWVKYSFAEQSMLFPTDIFGQVNTNISVKQLVNAYAGRLDLDDEDETEATVKTEPKVEEEQDIWPWDL